MDAIRNIARNVYDDLAPLATSLSKAASDLVSSESTLNETEGRQFVEKLAKTNYGQDLLARHKMYLFQTKKLNQETIRVSNLASTRMSALQQQLNEDWEAVRDLDVLLNRIPTITSQLDEIQKKTSELHQYCLQTEVAIAALDAKIGKGARRDEIIDVN
ncbi:hypothetical protein M3Y98_00510500 [Aphelenchoides besseyi]|nr:hypothetical protein M3Y98_00510500 [Aphelenchoides besseyi]KAI6207848.1 hypothetical protein M3Y96_00052400 [Aphelenchoides besseyi]